MAARRSLRRALLPGDGIGQEVMLHNLHSQACRRVLESFSKSFNLDFSFVQLPIGLGTFEQESGRPFPEGTLETLKKECDSALVGARLDLYANVRPVKTNPKSRNQFDLVIVRGNTEDIYVIKRISEQESGRIAGLAGELAQCSPAESPQ